MRRGVAALSALILALGLGRGAVTRGLEDDPPATPDAPAILVPPGPAAAPVPLDQHFVLLYYYLVGAGADLFVFGEIQNASQSDRTAPQLRFSFFDAAGGVLAEDAVDPLWGLVPAGGRMPFQTGTLSSGALMPGDWDGVRVTAGDPMFPWTALDTSELRIAGVAVEGVLHRDSGTVTNDGREPVSGVRIRLAQYDEAGVFVGACSEDRIDGTLGPGEVGRFEIVPDDCRFSASAKEARGSEGPYAYRIILTRSG